VRPKGWLRRLAFRAGWDITPAALATSFLAQRRKLFAAYGIDLVVDVGASEGQYAGRLRESGYDGDIVSFEPLNSAFAVLDRRARSDPHWRVEHCAIGATAGRAVLQVAANSVSSSLLPMLAAHSAAAPESAVVGQVDVEIRTLDQACGDICRPPRNVWLKCDTQGFERQVLEGAHNVLDHIDTVELEMSLVPLYAGEALFRELFDVLVRRGFELVGIQPAFVDPVSARVLQVDGIFHRHGAA
jgi:FkbM family methyltransferase